MLIMEKKWHKRSWKYKYIIFKISPVLIKTYYYVSQNILKKKFCWFQDFRNIPLWKLDSITYSSWSHRIYKKYPNTVHMFQNKIISENQGYLLCYTDGSKTSTKVAYFFRISPSPLRYFFWVFSSEHVELTAMLLWLQYIYHHITHYKLISQHIWLSYCNPFRTLTKINLIRILKQDLQVAWFDSR